MVSQEVLGNAGGATDAVIFAKEKKEKLLQASFTAAHLGKSLEHEMVFSRNPACPLSVISDYGSGYVMLLNSLGNLTEWT